MNNVCKICNSEFNSRMGLTNHIRLTHKLTCQQYYDTYIKSSKNEGFCEECGKETKFLNIEDGYAKVCCMKCAMPGRAKRNIEKYGYSDNFHNPEIHKLAHSKEANAKREKTMLKKYGNKQYLATEDAKQKTKKTLKDKYNTDHYSKTEEFKEKARRTCLKNHGVEYNLQRKEIIEKHKLASHTKEAIEKSKQTCLKNHGVECIFQLPDIKKKAQINSHTKEALEKRTRSRANHINEISYKSEQTKRKKGKNSKLEQLFEELCKQNNIKYIDNYYLDSRYPYLCDFYLPEYDCFIEIFGSWVHQDHIFGTKPQDKDILAIWKEKAKTSKLYAGAIQTWSVKDIKKLKCAKKNKINYKILWNKEQILNFFKESIYTKK